MLTEEFKEKVRSHIIEQSPAVKNLGIVMDFCGEDRVVLGLPIDKKTTNGYEICHGGSYMMLADSAMGAICFALNKKVVTLEANISYLKSAPIGTRLRAVASALHNGSRTLSCTCDIFDDDNHLCAQARGTFFVVGHIE